MTTMIVWLLIATSGSYGIKSTLATLPDKANCEYAAEQLKNAAGRVLCVQARIVVPK